MKDIFDAKISCKNCNVEMKPIELEKQGFLLRAMECGKCGEKIIHPADLEKLKRYNDMRGKTYSVKLRMVGNSHAISIPKEIVEFINQTRNKMRNQMNDMVRLCFEDFGKLSLDFMNPEQEQQIRRRRW